MKEESPRKTTATVFQIEDLNFAIANSARGKKDLSIYHFETGVFVGITLEETHQEAIEDFKDWAINRNNGIIQRIRDQLAENKYPNLNKIEEAKEKKEPKPRKKPTFFVKTAKDLFTLEYSNKFLVDGEIYITSKEYLAPHNIKPSICSGWVVYHYKSGRIASSGENAATKAILAFKDKFNSFSEEQKRTFRKNLAELEIINN